MERVKLFVVKLISLSIMTLAAELLLPRSSDGKLYSSAKRTIELTVVSALIRDAIGGG